MGDYIESFVHSMSGRNAPFYDDVKKHFSQQQTINQLVLIESLRARYPGRPIECSQNIDPVKYAEAGFAEARIIKDGNSFISTRRYVTEPNRLNAGEGRVDEQIIIGEFEYSFQGKTSTLYSIFIQQTNESFFFYVAPPGDNDAAWADAIIKATGKWTLDLNKEIYVFDNGCWQKNKLLWESVESASWDDVILDPTMKATLIKDVENFFDSRAAYEQYSVPWKRGIILHGTPGCGKTISIKALMNTMQDRGAISLYVKSFSTDKGRWSNTAIRSIFQHARRSAPCMLIFEDLDSLVVEEVRSYFLNEVDGLESNHGILMIGSTNHLERLDPGISKRPSRFDRKYHYKLPGERERTLYCEYWRTKLQHNSSLDFSPEVCKHVAKLTDGFSFAYLKELFVQTMLAIVGGLSQDFEDDSEEAAVVNAAENTKIDAGSAQLLQPGETTQSTQTADGDDTQPLQRATPDFTVPPHLQANALVHVLNRQLKALWKDMDNTADSVHERPKITSGEDTRRHERMLRKVFA